MELDHPACHRLSTTYNDIKESFTCRRVPWGHLSDVKGSHGLSYQTLGTVIPFSGLSNRLQLTE